MKDHVIPEIERVMVERARAAAKARRTLLSTPPPAREGDFDLIQRVLNDLMITFADTEFDEAEVEAARKRIMVYGTVGYKAIVTRKAA